MAQPITTIIAMVLNIALMIICINWLIFFPRPPQRAGNLSVSFEIYKVIEIKKESAVCLGRSCSISTADSFSKNQF